MGLSPSTDIVFYYGGSPLMGLNPNEFSTDGLFVQPEGFHVAFHPVLTNEFSTDGLFVQPEGFHVAFHPVLNFHGETCVIYHLAGGFRRSDQERLMEVSHGQLGVEDGVLVTG